MQRDFVFEQLKTPFGSEPVERVIYDGVIIGYVIPVELVGKKLKRDRYYFRFVKDNKVCVVSFPDKEKIEKFLQKYFDKKEERWKKETPERKNREVENFLIRLQEYEERMKIAKKYPYEYFEVAHPADTADTLEEELKIAIPDEIKKEINRVKIDQIDLLDRSLDSYIAVLTRNTPIITEAIIEIDDLNKYPYFIFEKLVQIYLLWKGIEKMREEGKLTSELRVIERGKFGIEIDTERVFLYVPRFKSDRYEFDETGWILYGNDDEEKIELFKHFLDRSLRVVLFELTKEKLKREGELPNLLFSASEIAFVNLGKFLFEELERINPEMAKEIEFEYGKFVPFKVELKGLYGVESEDEWRKRELRMVYNKEEEVNKLTIIKSPLTVQIIPYPIAGSLVSSFPIAKESLITSPEQAVNVFRDILDRLKHEMSFVDKNVIKAIYKDEYSLKQHIGKAIRNSVEIPINVITNLYLSTSDLMYYTPYKLAELRKTERNLNKSKKQQKRKFKC